jgi:hypothetical protein
MITEFKNKNGTLTVYAFACGYVETKGDYRLFKDGVWHIQGKGIWQTFSTLTEARKGLAVLARHEHEFETAFDNDGRESGAYCLDGKCSLFVRAGDFTA